MRLADNFLNLKNEFDFFLRRLIPWGRPIQSDADIPQLDRELQCETTEFMKEFDWNEALRLVKHDANGIVAADIGARNFAMGPVIENVLAKEDRILEIHGIEIDAFRRMHDFRTRKDYGEYYAHRLRRGFYHATDFLKWNTKLHVGLLLNPFVTRSPLLSWGLPLSAFRPKRIFEHAFYLLREQNGVLLVSAPCEEEFKLCLKHAKAAGFYEGERHEWRPHKHGVQKRPRLGIIFSTVPWLSLR